jgi:hypothetical protein
MAKATRDIEPRLRAAILDEELVMRPYVDYDDG